MAYYILLGIMALINIFLAESETISISSAMKEKYDEIILEKRGYGENGSTLENLVNIIFILFFTILFHYYIINYYKISP